MKIVEIAEFLKKGDTFDGIAFQVLINGAPKPIADTEILIQFRKDGPDGDVHKELTHLSGITKTDAAAGKFKIDAFLVDMPVGQYYWDCQLKDTVPTLKIKTYFGGKVPVKQDTSFI